MQFSKICELLIVERGPKQIHKSFLMVPFIAWNSIEKIEFEVSFGAHIS